MNGFLDGIWKPGAGGRFANRYDAGRAIANAIGHRFDGKTGTGVVAGLPRGGIEVAAAVSNDLKLPLDFRAVKKVGHPLHPEFAIGAVDISGTWVKNPTLGPSELPSDEDFAKMVDRALEQARAIERELRGDGKSLIESADWVLVVDDGAATGLTLLAVAKGLKNEGKEVHVALPVSSTQAQYLVNDIADSFLAVKLPEQFMAVSQFYDDFSPLSTSGAKTYLR